MEVDDRPGALPQNFDLETYASNYSGHAKINRLLFVAKSAEGYPLEIEALKMTIDEIKKTDNTAQYRDTVQLLAGRADGAYAFDSAWVEDTDRRFTQRLEAAETELSIARTNIVKESIRLGYSTIGDLHYNRGDVAEAFRQYLRTRDYCTTPHQTVQMCINVVKCALEMRHYLHVNTYVQKAEALPDGGADPEALAKLRAAQGIAYLAQHRYKLAARSFTSLPAGLGASFSDVLSAGDVATYGTLCALATMDRSDVGSRVIGSATFRELLSQAPVDVRDAAADFHASKYGAALAALARLRPVFSLDPYLADHADSLMAAVRAGALTEYTKPFVSLDLAAMAAAFNTDDKALEKELVALIASKDISGRIDTHARALLSRKSDPRAETYRAALSAAEQYLRGTKSMMLRAGMMRHDLIQRAAPGERPERPERPERGEGPRSLAHQRGEGPSRRARGGRERGRGGGDGAGPSGWATRIADVVDTAGGSMLAD